MMLDLLLELRTQMLQMRRQMQQIRRQMLQMRRMLTHLGGMGSSPPALPLPQSAVLWQAKQRHGRSTPSRRHLKSKAEVRAEKALKQDEAKACRREPRR